jgi:pyroglutamyl-peptidase
MPPAPGAVVLTRRVAAPAAALLLAGGCLANGDGAGGEPGVPVDDSPPDALYTDFLDGKFDGAGHPVGATVLEGEDGCSPDTGQVAGGDALVVLAGRDAAGVACRGTTRRLGRGVHTINVRVAPIGCDASDCAEDASAIEVHVVDAAGTVLGERTFEARELGSERAYRNLGLALTVREAGEVHVEVRWAGEVGLSIDYVEVFRRDRQLVVSPPSGVLDAAASFRIELVDPADDTLPRVRCNEEDLGERLAGLLAGEFGTDERTDFRRILTVPAAELFDGCGPDRVVEVQAGEGWRAITSEVRYLAEAPACDYTDGRVRVLLTGFVPFPAGSRSVNSSSLAVSSFEPMAVPGAAVMRLYLPVEFEAAAAIVRDVIARCEPDVVVGFGQGRHRVDLETTAYNRRDTSEVAGGVPDNRGIIHDGDAIVPDAPDTLSSRLAIDAIEAAIAAAGIDVGPSDDPGLYVCNDLFYSLLRATGEEVAAGFVHLPRVFSPTDEDRERLRTVVDAVVRQSVAPPAGA